MNTHINLTIDTRYKKKNGTYNICLQLVQGLADESRLIPTGVSIPLKDWDDKKKEVKTTYEGVSSVVRLNRQLAIKKKEATDVLISLEELGLLETLPINEVKKKITQSNVGNSFFTYANSYLENLKLAGRFGTHDSYKDAVRALENFHGNRSLTFPQLTYDCLKKFEAAHYAKGNKTNGLAAYMRAIRAIYNEAIKSGIAEEKHYPFKYYTIKTEPTRKKAMLESAMKKLASHKLPDTHPLFHTRNFCVASYMMWGMNYMDMAYFKKEHIIDGRIHYRRSKTSKLYDIKITPALNEILSYYNQLNPQSKYVFPILKRDSAELQHKDIKWARARYNEKLKELAAECKIKEGIPVDMASNVIRHSFATHAALLEIPLLAISAMLGHSSVKTTQIYIKELPINMLDEYTDKIMKNKRTKANKKVLLPA